MSRYAKPTVTALGAFIRARREQRGMTLEQLGERSGLKFQQLSRYEIGNAVPRLSTALTLAEALSCSIEDMANEAKKDHKPPANGEPSTDGMNDRRRLRRAS